MLLQTPYRKSYHAFCIIVGRKFVLVGDSSEKDPEIYGAVAREYPEQIICKFVTYSANEMKFTANYRLPLLPLIDTTFHFHLKRLYCIYQGTLIRNVPHRPIDREDHMRMLKAFADVPSTRYCMNHIIQPFRTPVRAMVLIFSVFSILLTFIKDMASLVHSQRRIENSSPLTPWLSQIVVPV